MNPSPDGSALPSAPAEGRGSRQFWLKACCCPSAQPGEAAPPVPGGGGSLEAASSVTTDAGEPAGTDGEAGGNGRRIPGAARLMGLTEGAGGNGGL